MDSFFLETLSQYVQTNKSGPQKPPTVHILAPTSPTLHILCFWARYTANWVFKNFKGNGYDSMNIMAHCQTLKALLIFTHRYTAPCW